MSKKKLDLVTSALSEIGRLDAADEKNWASIITKACAAGVKEELLCGEAGCAKSTIQRWKDGITAPGPCARGNIKTKILEMLTDSLGELVTQPKPKKPGFGGPAL